MVCAASTGKPFNTQATLGTSASTLKTRREQESQEDKEARLDRQHLRTNYLTPRQRWVPQLVIYKGTYIHYILHCNLPSLVCNNGSCFKSSLLLALEYALS